MVLSPSRTSRPVNNSCTGFGATSVRPPQDVSGGVRSRLLMPATVRQDRGMATRVTENKDDNRFEIFVDDELAGWVEYHEHEGVSAFLHTEIKPEFGGQGLAKQLIAES